MGQGHEAIDGEYILRAVVSYTSGADAFETNGSPSFTVV